jgi:hypothetical protein
MTDLKLRRMVVTDATAKERCYAVFFVSSEKLDPRVRSIAVAVKAGPHPTEGIGDAGLLAGPEHQSQCTEDELRVVHLLIENAVGVIAHRKLVIIGASEKELPKLAFCWIPFKFVGATIVPVGEF